MPSYKQNIQRCRKRPLPKTTTDYLSNGTFKGNRNNAVFEAACQFRDCGYSTDEAKTQIWLRADQDGLSQSETFDAIDSAYRGNQRPPAWGTQGRGAASTAASNAKAAPFSCSCQAHVPLPGPMPDGFKVLLETCFEDGEYISIEEPNPDPDPDKNGKPLAPGVTLKRDRLLATGPGRNVFIRINPMRPPGKSDKDVTSFRHVLAEIDLDENGNRIPLETQYEILLRPGFPIHALIFSGDKSLHAWIRVDAKDWAEWDARRDVVYDKLLPFGIDPNNKNPSRYSRLPGVPRGTNGQQQELRAVNIGPASWEEWEKNVPNEKRERLRKHLAPLSVTDLPANPPPELVRGLLYQGCKISFSGTPKSYKTWNLLHFFFCLANGLGYLGFQCVKTPVVIFDFELIPFALRERLVKIASQYNLPGDPLTNIRIVPLKGRIVDFADGDVQDVILEDFKANGIGAFGIDPLYKALERLNDENSNIELTHALRPFEALTVDGEVSFAYNQHFAKGDQTRKTAMDRIAGGGTFARDPDALFIISKLKTENAYAVEIIQRYFPPIAPFAIRWQQPIFVRDDSLDPNDLEPPPKVGRPQSNAADKILAALRGAEASGGLTKPQLEKATGISEPTVRRHLKRLINDGIIILSQLTNTYQLSAKEAQKWNEP
jgi:RecA-family ATPase